MTDEIYYENKENWGNSQYISLKNVLDNILITADNDSYFKHSERHVARIYGKQGIKMLNVDIKSQSKAISIDVPSSKIFPFPRYMTNWSVVYVVNDCGNLEELNINNTPSIREFIQDNCSELLYDCNGSVIEGNEFNANEGDCRIKIQPCEQEQSNCGCGSVNGKKIKSFNDSWVRENKEGNYFEFSDDLVDRTIVIKFKTAGLEGIEDCDIKIDSRLEMTITRYIQWNLLMGKRNTPITIVREYEKFYKNEKRRSNNLLGSKITLNQIIKSVSLRYN